MMIEGGNYMSGLGNKEIMANNIQYYMDMYQKTRQDMCDALGVKYTTFSHYISKLNQDKQKRNSGLVR